MNGRRNLCLAVAFTTGIMSLAACGLGDGTPGDHGLTGVFKDASPLEPGSEVRLSGVRIGTVDDITLEDGLAHVTVDTEVDELPLHADARMTIKPVNLLGEHYVAIDPGTPSKPMMEGSVVPVSQTSTTVTLQEVLNTLDDPTANALAALLTGLGEGVLDSGTDAAQAIKALAPAMAQATDLGDVLSDQNTVLTRLLERVQPIAASLGTDEGAVLDQLVTNTEQMLAVVADEQAALDATLVELPGTLTAARRTLARVAGVSATTTPTLRVLRPLTDNLEEVTDELFEFADAADPALASLTPVLEHADELLDEAAPVVAMLRASGPQLRGTSRKLRPVGDQLLDVHLGDLMDFVRKWALSTNGKDGLSHYFRGVIHITPTTMNDLIGSATQPPPDDTDNPLPDLPDLNLPDLELPGVLPDLLNGLLPGDGDTTLGGLLGGRRNDNGQNATGLTPHQEQSLLNQMLGGQ